MTRQELTRAIYLEISQHLLRTNGTCACGSAVPKDAGHRELGYDKHLAERIARRIEEEDTEWD